ncbi:MAG TPA: VOC family protein [Solirubrobacteraceae bacterium]|nr:VOC family protein [Solirubrobacteraceae bacterium]
MSDLGAARDWWGSLFGRPADLLPNDDEAAWEAQPGGWICLIADTAAAGTALHTLLVADLDGFIAAAGERDVEAGPVEDVGPDMRQAIFADPDGNRLKVAARRAQGE